MPTRQEGSPAKNGRTCVRRNALRTTTRPSPIILYAIFGTSRALAVGPVAVVSLMTAAAIGNIAEQGTMGYAVAALILAGLSGAILLAMGLLKLGFLANFLSHPVIAGFITASGVLIATSQIKHILGVSAGGDTLPEMVVSLAENLSAVNCITLVIGIGATGSCSGCARE
jgi:SulP family sulfate permease